MGTAPVFGVNIRRLASMVEKLSLGWWGGQDGLVEGYEDVAAACVR